METGIKTFGATQYGDAANAQSYQRSLTDQGTPFFETKKIPAHYPPTVEQGFAVVYATSNRSK